MLSGRSIVGVADELAVATAAAALAERRAAVRGDRGDRPGRVGLVRPAGAGARDHRRRRASSCTSSRSSARSGRTPGPPAVLAVPLPPTRRTSSRARVRAVDFGLLAAVAVAAIAWALVRVPAPRPRRPELRRQSRRPRRLNGSRRTTRRGRPRRSRPDARWHATLGVEALAPAAEQEPDDGRAGRLCGLPVDDRCRRARLRSIALEDGVGRLRAATRRSRQGTSRARPRPGRRIAICQSMNDDSSPSGPSRHWRA